ncbi:MAG: UvrD-helicase domain-containing protein [Pseudomonadota bacterium]
MTAAYEHNGQPVTAEAFYAIACDPRRSVAVEACAGAGKTWMLVSRMLRALLDDNGRVQPHEILAITFTKKAAGEMRERLYEWLEKFAHADDETLRHELLIRGVLSQKSATAPAELREQLANLYQRVLASGRPVQIRTFHSWFAALLRSAPMATLQQLGLPVNYELLEDDAQAKALVWRRFYAALAASPELKADFEDVVLTHGRFQADKALQVALDKRTEFTLADEQGVVDASVEHFGVMFPECAGLGHPDEHFSSNAPCRALMTAAATSLGRASAPTFSAKGVELEKAITAGDFQAALSALLTEKGTARKFGEKIVGIETIREAQELALRLAAARHQHEAWDYQQRMARLSRLLLAEFKSLKRERGWIDMNDVERAALTMLGDTVLSGWVQERLDARIRHLMIDEFQDTNPLQWQALSAWLMSYSGAGKAPSVFIVGDPKQSIYRFRRAEPQVFIAAQKFIREGLGGDLLACDHTRRNSVAVINTVNAVMGDARDNDGYTGFRDHTSASEESGMAIRLPPIPREARDTSSGQIAEEGWRDSLTTPRELPEETLRTREARQAAAWIATRIAQGLVPSEVMVLSRKRAGLLPLQDELRVLHIPAQVGEKTELIDCCEVLDIVALLDVLVSTQHDLSLARALRSPLFGLSDDALVQIVLARGETKAAWFEVLQKHDLAIPELDGIAARLLKYKSWVDSLPPHDALQAIYHDGDVLARFAAAAPASARNTVLANLRALLNVALQLDGGRYATPYAFVRALKAGGLQAPAAVNPDAVRLLTIHGAKGLEAEAVLLLDTDTLERNADSMGVLIDWPGEAIAPQKFVFLVSESRPPACAVPMLEKEQAERAREELNALYVALTRARNTLVVSSITPHRETTRSWWQRLYPFAQDVAAPEPASPAADVDATDAATFTLAELPELPADKTLAAPPPIGEDDAAKDTDSSRFGQAMHRLLELGVQGNAPAARRVADAVARQFRLVPAKMEEAIAMATRIRQGEAAWIWDPAVIAWQANEIELMVGGQSRRIDRLVQRRDAGHEGHWWVIDYKSAHRPEEDPELLGQMAAYRAALQAIYPGEVVKAAFLTGRGALVEVT